MRKRPCIMVVDKDQDMLKMLNHTLKLEGYEVVTAADGSSALAHLEKRRPELVILEIMMPDSDVFQVLDRMRQCCSVPIIMLTEGYEVTSVQKSVALDANDYVTKPFSSKELVACVRAVLTSS